MKETLDSLQEQLRDVDEDRSKIVSEKKEIEACQAEITAEIRGNHNIQEHRWKTLLRDQARYKRQQSDMDAKLGELSTLRRRLNSLIDGVKRDESHKDGAKKDRTNSIRLRLLDLKNKYAEFSADASRVASMRQMAAKFSIEIEQLLVEDAKGGN